jgi:predicted amidohydrolase
MRTLTIAAIQTSPVTSDLDATWQRFADQVYAVKDTFGRVELVVVPELLLTAEPPLLQARAEWTEQVAVSIPGRLTHRICALAKETVLWLVPGSLYERDGDDIYNTAIAVSPDGEIVTKYLNGADPWGVGASAIVDPEGVIRQQAGPGEEILVDTIDLDTVTKVRTYGTFGLTTPWDQLARHGADVQLPMYGGSIKTPKWHRAEHDSTLAG